MDSEGMHTQQNKADLDQEQAQADQTLDSSVDNKPNPSPKPKTKTSIKILIAALVVLLIAAAVGIGYLLYVRSHIERAQQQETDIPLVAQDTAVTKAQNPIDFASLQASNPDIYAWIYVPNTNVNYAVCQNAVDDFYYLDHDSNAEYSLPGAIYSEIVNAKDFSDPVTLLYGHSGYGDLMFGTLHNFEDADFFEANDTFYIYIPGHILSYHIVSAYMYDDRHIMNAFNFKDTEVLAEYFATVTQPQSLTKNVREGATLTTSDKLLQLSTCMESWSQGNSRYLVNGVLVNDQLTY